MNGKNGKKVIADSQYLIEYTWSHTKTSLRETAHHYLLVRWE